MKYLHLVWSNLLRKKIRTVLTFLSIFVAFLLFGVTASLKAAFGMGVELIGVDRLVMLHKVSIIQPLPISYKERIASDKNVVDVSHANWFGGIYQDPKNQFPQFAVDPESYLRLYPELAVPEDQKKAWLANRTGALVGRALIDKYGWQIGDRIPIQGTIYRRPNDAPWEFTIEGIYDGDKGVDTSTFLFHYKYLTEGSSIDGLVGWYILRIEDPESAAQTAERIDSRFANSPYETKTSTEKAFVQSFANQIGNIGSITVGIMAAVFFTMLLVTGNTMAQSVRERTNELAVLKTLGFSDLKVMSLVLGESLVLSILGGALGLGFIVYMVQTRDLGGTIFPTLHMPLRDTVVGIALVFLLGLATGSIPAIQALRLKIVEALRRR